MEGLGWDYNNTGGWCLSVQIFCVYCTFVGRSWWFSKTMKHLFVSVGVKEIGQGRAFIKWLRVGVWIRLFTVYQRITEQGHKKTGMSWKFHLSWNYSKVRQTRVKIFNIKQANPKLFCQHPGINKLRNLVGTVHYRYSQQTWNAMSKELLLWDSWYIQAHGWG